MRICPYVFGLWFVQSALFYLFAALQKGAALPASDIPIIMLLMMPMTLLALLVMYLWVRVEGIYFITPETKFEMLKDTPVDNG